MNARTRLIQEGRITDPHSARGRLLTQAAQLFKEKGYERTTVRDLASAVGIQSGSIFHHFKTKEDILFSVMEETILYLTTRMEEALEAAEGAEARLLALIICELNAILGGTSAAMTVLVYEWRSLSVPRQEQILTLRQRYEQLWLDVLEECKTEGLVTGDLFILRRFLTGALSWTITWYRPNGKLTMEDLAREALGLAVKR